MMKKSVVFLLSVMFTVAAVAQKTYPKWVDKVIKSKDISAKYEVTSFTKPGFLLADFNGDKKEDCALLIKEKSSGKAGILIIHNDKNETFILGAGKQFGNANDDFSWMKKWTLHKDSTATESIYDKRTGEKADVNIIKLSTIALDLADQQSVFGIVYWDGEKYVWLQQGD